MNQHQQTMRVYIMKEMIEALQSRRYVMCLVSNESLDMAEDSLIENPDAVTVCYDYDSNGMFWTNKGKFKYVIVLSDIDIYL